MVKAGRRYVGRVRDQDVPLSTKRDAPIQDITLYELDLMLGLWLQVPGIDIPSQICLGKRYSPGR